MSTPKNYRPGSRGRVGGKGIRNLPHMDDPFMSSDVPSGKGNLFSPAPHNSRPAGATSLSTQSQSRNFKGELASSASHSPFTSNTEIPNASKRPEQASVGSKKSLTDDDDSDLPYDNNEVDQEDDEYEDGDDAEEDSGWHSDDDNQQDFNLVEFREDLKLEEEDGEDSGVEPGDFVPMFTSADGEKIGPYHHSVPQAMNVMHKYRNKAEAGKDPNGRKAGRNLVMWHRPRMMDKLVLHIQYECHLAKIALPWDKIAHRLSPGSSGPAIIQYLNKNRDVLIAEGHMIPPNMGKSKAVYDETIRGYVRDESQEIPTVVRSLPWNEKYADKKKSLVVPGMILGSGRYDRNKENRIQVPKETGRRSRVPQDTKEKMTENRSKRKVSVRKNASRKRAKSPKSPKSPKIKDEIDPAELNSDDDYNPSATASNKRKAKGVSTSRKKARGGKELPAIESDNELTPTKQIKQAGSVAKSTTKSVASKAMASLSIETPTKPSPAAPSLARVQKSTENRPISAIKKNTTMAKAKATTEDTDSQVNLAVKEVGNVEFHEIGQQTRINSRLSQNTSSFAASPLDIQSPVQAGRTPPHTYNLHSHAPQVSPASRMSDSVFASFQPHSVQQYRPLTNGSNYMPVYQPGNPYGSGNNSYGGSNVRGSNTGGSDAGGLPTYDNPAPGSYEARRRAESGQRMSTTRAVPSGVYTNSNSSILPRNPYTFSGSGVADYGHPAGLTYAGYPTMSYTNANAYNRTSANPNVYNSPITNTAVPLQTLNGSYGLGDPAMDQENLVSLTDTEPNGGERH